MATLLDAAAARHPETEAVVRGDERVAFAALRHRAEALAHGLEALGLGPGDRLALWLPPSLAWFVTLHACARAGIVLVPIDPRASASAVGATLAVSRASALLVTDHLGSFDYLEILHAVLPSLATAVPGELECAAFPALRHVIVDADDPYPGCHRLADVAAAGAEATRTVGARAGGPADVLAILDVRAESAGSLLPHGEAVWAAGRVAESVGVTAGDRLLSLLPAPGTREGLALGLGLCSRGACLVVAPGREPALVRALLERERITLIHDADAPARDGMPAIRRVR